MRVVVHMLSVVMLALLKLMMLSLWNCSQWNVLKTPMNDGDDGVDGVDGDDGEERFLLHFHFERECLPSPFRWVQIQAQMWAQLMMMMMMKEVNVEGRWVQELLFAAMTTGQWLQNWLLVAALWALLLLESVPLLLLLLSLSLS